MTFNDLFILKNPEIHTISCGAAKPQDLDLHAQAVNQMDELTDTVRDIKARLDEALVQIYEPAWAQHYTLGLPNWPEAPGQVNIKIILWLWNLVQAFDLTDYAKFRYNLLGNAAHWFPGEQVSKALPEQADALHVAIKESPYAERIMEILPKAHALLGKEEGQRLQADL